MRHWIMSGLFLLLAACGGGGEPPVSATAPVPQPPTPPSAPPPPSPPVTVAACPVGLPVSDIDPSANVATDCDPSSFDALNDIPYGTGADHLLDLLVPRGATGPMPVVVWIHGGGWQSGDKSNRAQSQRLACRGYAVASINYRLSGTAIFPAQIHDVKAAIRFLRANAATYNLDASRIAAFGSSAGGHLAALAGTSDGVDSLEDLGQGNAATSSRVQAVVDWYGPADLASMDTHLLAQGCPAGSARHSEPDSPESGLLGCTVSDPACSSQLTLANPATHADATDAPMLLLHGTTDCTVPTEQSAVLAEALTRTQACAVLRRVNGAGHGGTQWVSVEVQDATADFLDRVLVARTPSAAVANCAAFEVTGDAASSAGARWSYSSTDDGMAYVLSGTLFVPPGNGPFPSVVVSHGAGGNASGYSANIARTMRDWGMVAIATNYTHAPDTVDAGLLPQGGDGASPANVARAHKTRDLLSCVAGTDLRRVAAHGHSMGAFVTGQMLGTWPEDFAVASHTAGGANETGPNATRSEVAMRIRTPYQLHHGNADTVVNIGLDRALADILAGSGVRHQLLEYPGYDHEQMALDALMLERVRDWYRAQGLW